MSALIVCEAGLPTAQILQKVAGAQLHTKSSLHLLVAYLPGHDPAITAQSLRQSLKAHALSADISQIDWLPAAELPERVQRLTLQHQFELVWW